MVMCKIIANNNFFIEQSGAFCGCIKWVLKVGVLRPYRGLQAYDEPTLPMYD